MCWPCLMHVCRWQFCWPGRPGSEENTSKFIKIKRPMAGKRPEEDATARSPIPTRQGSQVPGYAHWRHELLALQRPDKLTLTSLPFWCCSCDLDFLLPVSTLSTSRSRSALAQTRRNRKAEGERSLVNFSSPLPFFIF